MSSIAEAKKDRERFESERNTGFLSKGFARFLNILYNWVFKVVLVGVILNILIMPFVVIIVAIIALIIIIGNIPLAIIVVVFWLLVNILFFDNEVDTKKYPGIVYITWFPLFYEFFYRFLWKGVF